LRDIPDSLLVEIKKYCIKNKNQESCGIIHQGLQGLHFLGCRNLSSYPRESFILEPNLIVDYDVKYVVHSHIIGSSKPSSCDTSSSNELCIPFLIYSLIDDDFYLYENISV